MGLLLVASATLLVGAIVFLLSPPRDQAGLPPGAAPLALRTQPWKPWPMSGFGCPMGLVAPIRVERDGASLGFTRVDIAEPASIVWPSGFSARVLDGRAELVAPDGAVLAREGDVVSDLAGAAADNGDILVCFDLASKPTVESP